MQQDGPIGAFQAGKPPMMAPGGPQAGLSGSSNQPMATGHKQVPGPVRGPAANPLAQVVGPNAGKPFPGPSGKAPGVQQPSMPTAFTSFQNMTPAASQGFPAPGQQWQSQGMYTSGIDNFVIC